MRPRTLRTAGEQATVFSLKSRRRPSRLPSGGWYSFMPRTRARGTGCVNVTGSDTCPPFESHANGFSMAGEPLRFCDQRGMRTKLRNSLRRIFLHGDELDEIVDAQAPPHARHPAGGQRMVGTGD